MPEVSLELLQSMVQKVLENQRRHDQDFHDVMLRLTSLENAVATPYTALGTTLTTQIENLKSQASALGLDTQAAADATKNAVEVFLGLKNT
ncbi:MAG: hypothetical protein F8N39_17080 [Clostridiaceae bacterium]|nr:hypothetical protein [Clostridiaceae bacterium]